MNTPSMYPEMLTGEASRRKIIRSGYVLAECEL
jgi:hypothetical protein